MMAEQAFVSAGRESERELDALMTEFSETGKAGAVAGAGPNARAEGPNGVEWDRLTLLTGGFVPVGSLFWARPPKLKSQQKILLAMQEADAIPEEENVIEASIKRGNILLKLASELFHVQEAGNFRPATEEEIGGDEVGLDATEIRDAFYRLMGISTEAVTEGNA